MSNYHGDIMNIQFKRIDFVLDEDVDVYSYKLGHRDARHEAAQLGEHADCVIEELREALDDAKCHFYTLMNDDNSEFIREVVEEINEVLKLGGN